MTQPETFILHPDAYPTLRKRTIIAFIAGALIMVLIYGTRIVFRSPDEVVDTEKLRNASILAGIILPISIVRLLRRQKATIGDFSLVIDDDSITVYPSQPKEQVLTRILINQIIKNSDGSFVILGNAGQTTINIPAQVQNPERLEARLNEFAPVAVNAPNSFTGRYYKHMMLAILALLLGFIFAADKVLVAVTGGTLLLTIGWIVLAFFNGKDANESARKVKRALIVIGVCVIAKLVYVLVTK